MTGTPDPWDRVERKADAILDTLSRLSERITRLESLHTDVHDGKLDQSKLWDKHTELDKRVVSLETKSLFFSGIVATIVSLVVSFIDSVIHRPS